MASQAQYLYQHGTAEAQFEQGLQYYQQRDTLPNGLEQAKKWFFQAAKQEHLDAMFNLAVILEQEGDVKIALPWFLKAAKGGHVQAMYNVGTICMYLVSPTEQEQVKEMAVHWMQQAAVHDFPPALNNMGCFYRSGYGSIRPCKNTAIQYFKRAGALGVEQAKKNLATLFDKGVKSFWA